MSSFSRILGQSWKVKFHKVKLLKSKTFNFDLKFCWNWSFFHYEKIMRFKKSPQLPGAGRTRARHYHRSHTATSPVANLLSKMACQPKHFGPQCISFWVAIKKKTNTNEMEKGHMLKQNTAGSKKFFTCNAFKKLQIFGWKGCA